MNKPLINVIEANSELTKERLIEKLQEIAELSITSKANKYELRSRLSSITCIAAMNA